MIIKKHKKSISKLESILRQQIEEKPYLLQKGKELQFYNEVLSRVSNIKLNFKFNITYAKDWLLGYRKRKNIR